MKCIASSRCNQNWQASTNTTKYECKTLIKIDEITNIGKHVNIDLRFKFIYSKIFIKIIKGRGRGEGWVIRRAEGTRKGLDCS